MDVHIMNIHLICAMHGEAQHIINALNLKKINHSELNFDLFEGVFKDHVIRLFVNQKDENNMDKLGTVQVGILTYKSIVFLKPDLMINLGTCGGIFDHNLRLLDIICGQKFAIYHDRFTGDSENSIKQSLRFSTCLNLENYLKDHDFKHGAIASSNSLLLNPNSWNHIKKYKIQCLDMEAAAVAEVAQDSKIPLMIFKVVTDNVYEVNPVDAFSQFEANFHPAMKHLAEKFLQVLPQLVEFPLPSQYK